jgi:hypothetical protein
VERINRRHIMFAVVGAAGLALVVDKLVLSGSVSSPASAKAGQAGTQPKSTGPSASGAGPVSGADTSRSPAAKLTLYRKASAPGTSQDAMKYPAWANTSTGTSSTAVSGTTGIRHKHTFVLSGVANDAVRLRREGDARGMERGRVLRVGDTVAWSPEAGVSVRLVSIAKDNQSAIIEVDGERREIARAGSDPIDGADKGRLSPSSSIHVERASDRP